jgi:hypothetical protein
MYTSTGKIIFSHKHFPQFSAELSHLQGILICDNEVGLLLVWYHDVHICIKHQHVVTLKYILCRLRLYFNVYTTLMFYAHMIAGQ